MRYRKGRVVEIWSGIVVARESGGMLLIRTEDREFTLNSSSSVACTVCVHLACCAEENTRVVLASHSHSICLCLAQLYILYAPVISYSLSMHEY
jgi:hypothetical protein